jgi:hypothetical protein
MLTTALGISYVMLNIERAILTGYAIRWVASGNPHHKAVIYGAGVVGKHLFKRIFHSPALGLKVIGFLEFGFFRRFFDISNQTCFLVYRHDTGTWFFVVCCNRACNFHTTDDR